MAIDGLSQAYNTAAAELNKKPDVAPLCGKVQTLFQKMQQALHPEAAAHGVGAAPVVDAARIHALHDTFVGKLSPAQQKIFQKIERALELGLEMPANAAFTIDTDKQSAEITRITQALDGKTTLQSLQKLEFYVWRLLENQPTPVPEKIQQLFERFVHVFSDATSNAIKGAKTLPEVLQKLHMAVQFFERIGGHQIDKKYARSCIEAFHTKSAALLNGYDKRIDTITKGTVQQTLNARNEAQALFEALSIVRCTFQNIDAKAVVALNAPIKKLADHFHFDEVQLVKKVAALGPEALPIPALQTASKCQRVARFILPAAGLTLKAASMYAEGRSMQDILMATAGNLAVQKLVTQIVPKAVPAFMADAAAVVVGSMVTAQLTMASKSVVELPPAQPGLSYPMTPLNATAPVLDLPMSALPPHYPGETPRPLIDISIDDQITSLANDILKTATHYVAQAATLSAGVAYLIVQAKSGVKL